MKKLTSLSILCLAFCINAFAQQNQVKSPGFCRQEYIDNTFIKPQLKKGPLVIKDTKDIDSLFTAMEAGWRKASADTLKKYPSELTLEEYSYLDDYCYFWTLASITQNLNAGSTYNKTLLNYMIPAMLRDQATLKRSPTPSIIKMIDPWNTLTLGSGNRADEATFEKIYRLYTDFSDMFNKLTSSRDTAVSHAAAVQAKKLDYFYYLMHAGNAYFTKDYDKAFNYLIVGLNANRYPSSRAVDMAKKLVSQYTGTNDKDKCYALLNTLAVNVTADNLDRAALFSLYKKVDATAGPQKYNEIIAKLGGSIFTASAKTLKLPSEWKFIANAIVPEKLKKAKYIIADFWYTGCGPCRAEIPELNALYDRLKLRDDVLFISVNTDRDHGDGTIKYIQEQCRELKINFPVYYDEPVLALNKQLQVPGYPSKYIFTVQGGLIEKTNHSAVTLDTIETFLKEQKQ